MWRQPPQQTYNVPSPHKIEGTDSDAHGHSPRRRDGSKDSSRMDSRGLLPPPAIPDPYWSSTPTLPDPFIEIEKHPKLKKGASQLSSEDQSMPDYPRPFTPLSKLNSNSHAVGPYGACGALGPDESQFEELMASYSPGKNAISGTLAPANTRASSATSPPDQLLRLSAAETRDSSYEYEDSHSISMTIQDPRLLPTRESSSASMKSNYLDFSDEPVGSPAKSIRGKKEGRASDANLSTRMERNLSARSSSSHEQEMTRDADEISLSGGKRKRKSAIPVAKALGKLKSSTTSSPHRKVAKSNDLDDFCGHDEEESPTKRAIRTPLITLNNIH